jgi:gamma-glutamyltranspeptidase/glutathione hydrolase
MLAQDIDRGKGNLSKYPTTAKIYLPGGQPLKAGELLKNPDYANTLRKLVDAERQAREGCFAVGAPSRPRFDRFYKGRHCARSRSLLQENGGDLTAADLAAYEPQFTEPLHTVYRG